MLYGGRSGFSPPKMIDSGKRPLSNDSPDSIDRIRGASHAKSTKKQVPVMYTQPQPHNVFDDVESHRSGDFSDQEDVLLLELDIAAEQCEAEARMLAADERARAARRRAELSRARKAAGCDNRSQGSQRSRTTRGGSSAGSPTEPTISSSVSTAVDSSPSP